ncbi:hypothetical protein BGX21_004737, partial [Mortierella sp. AD011]
MNNITNVNAQTNEVQGVTNPPVEAEQATATPMMVDEASIDDGRQQTAEDITKEIDTMSIDDDEEDNDDTQESLWELTQRALERVNVAQQVHTKAIMDQARFVEYQKRKTNTAMNEVVKTVVDFLQVFERYYRQALTSLFDDLASRYMLDALKSSELTERYEQALTRPGYQDNNWENVQACVRSIFKLNELQTELRSKLFAIKPNHHESIYDYTQRIKILVKGSGVEPNNRDVILAIAYTLPDQGKEKLVSEYTEDLLVPSINMLIDYMNRNPTVLSGDRSDPLNWVIKSYSKKRSSNPEKLHASQGSTSGYSNNKNRDFGNKGYSRRGASNKAPQFNKKRYEAYPKPTPKTVGFDNKDKCRHPTCVKFGRTHTAAQCFSKTNPSKFEALNKSEGDKSDKSPGKTVRSFAIKHARTFREESLSDTLGNSIEYNPNAIKEDAEPYIATTRDFKTT